MESCPDQLRLARERAARVLHCCQRRRLAHNPLSGARLCGPRGPGSEFKHGGDPLLRAAANRRQVKHRYCSALRHASSSRCTTRAAQQRCLACFVSVGKLLLAVSAFSRARISMLAPHKHFYVVVAGFVFVTKLLLAVWCDTYSSIGAVTPEPIPPAPSRRRLPLWEFDTGPVAHPHRHGLFVVMLLGVGLGSWRPDIHT